LNESLFSRLGLSILIVSPQSTEADAGDAANGTGVPTSTSGGLFSASCSAAFVACGSIPASSTLLHQAPVLSATSTTIATSWLAAASPVKAVPRFSAIPLTVAVPRCAADGSPMTTSVAIDTFLAFYRR